MKQNLLKAIRQNRQLLQFLYEDNHDQKNIRYYLIKNQPSRKYRMGQWLLGLMITREYNQMRLIESQQIVWIIKQGMVSSKIQQNLKLQLGYLKSIRQKPHTSILKYYEYFYRQFDSYLYVIAQYFDGIPLEFKSISAPELFNNISLQLLKGFQHLQTLSIFTVNLIILVNNRMQIKISDFGLQRSLDSLNYQYCIQSNICIYFPQAYKPHTRLKQLYDQYSKSYQLQDQQTQNKRKRTFYSWIYGLLMYNKLYSIFLFKDNRDNSNKNKDQNKHKQYRIRNCVGQYSHTACSLLKCLNIKHMKYKQNYKMLTQQILKKLKQYDQINYHLSQQQVVKYFQFYTDGSQGYFNNKQASQYWISVIVDMFKEYIFQPFRYRVQVKKFIQVFHRNKIVNNESCWKTYMIQHFVEGKENFKQLLDIQAHNQDNDNKNQQIQQQNQQQLQNQSQRQEYIQEQNQNEVQQQQQQQQQQQMQQIQQYQQQQKQQIAQQMNRKMRRQRQYLEVLQQIQAYLQQNNSHLQQDYKYSQQLGAMPSIIPFVKFIIQVQQYVHALKINCQIYATLNKISMKAQQEQANKLKNKQLQKSQYPQQEQQQQTQEQKKIYINNTKQLKQYASQSQRHYRQKYTLIYQQQPIIKQYLSIYIQQLTKETTSKQQQLLKNNYNIFVNLLRSIEQLCTITQHVIIEQQLHIVIKQNILDNKMRQFKKLQRIRKILSKIMYMMQQFVTYQFLDNLSVFRQSNLNWQHKQRQLQRYLLYFGLSFLHCFKYLKSLKNTTKYNQEIGFMRSMMRQSFSVEIKTLDQKIQTTNILLLNHLYKQKQQEQIQNKKTNQSEYNN